MTTTSAAQQTPRSPLAGCLNRYLRGFGLRIVVTVGVLLLWGACMVAGTPLFVILQAPAEYAFVFSFVGGAFTALAVGIGLILAWRVRRDRRMNETFAELGLHGSAYLLSGRRYDGQYAETRVEMFFYRGPMLDIYFYAPCGAQATFAVDNPIARGASRVLDREPVPLADPALAGYVLFAEDRQWAENLVADDQARASISALLRPPHPGSPMLQLQADRLLVRFSYANINAVDGPALSSLLQALHALAQRVAALPAPEIPAKPHVVDQRMRNSRWSSPVAIVGISLGVLGAVTVCSLSIAVVLIMLSGG